MSRQCPLCIGRVSPRAFVMLYTDLLSKVAARLPSPAVFIFSLASFFISICDCSTGYYPVTDYQQKGLRKRLN